MAETTINRRASLKINQPSRSSVLSFCLIFFLAATPRLVYAFVGDNWGTGAEMEQAAANLARHGELANVFSSDSGVSAHVAPLYAVGLSLVYQVFGQPRIVGRLAQRVFCVLATSIAIALLPILGRRLGLNRWTGYVAGAVMALSPVNLWVECSGCWEQPYAALGLLVLVFAFAVLHHSIWQSRSQAAATGLLCGLTALLSPSVIPAAGLMIGAELCYHAGRRRDVLRGAAVMLAVSGLCIAPWIYRNYHKLGGFVAVRSNFGLELWLGNNPQATGRTFGTNAEDSNGALWPFHPYTSKAECAHLKAIGELAYMREKQHQALTWISDHPRRFVELTFTRAQAFWLPPVDMWGPSTSARGLKAAFFWLVTLGTIGGLACLLHGRHPCAGLLLGGIIGPALIYLFTHVDLRYRYPIFALSTLVACEAALRLLRSMLTHVRSWKSGQRLIHRLAS